MSGPRPAVRGPPGPRWRGARLYTDRPVALTYRTAGESHGPALFAVVEGLPAGLPLVPDDIDADLARRQLGYGRGGRMKIERDRVQVMSGLRHGRTLGSPLMLEIPNLDWPNWERDRMAIWASPEQAVAPITLPRPGHADLAGMLKFGSDDLRPILERASARETAARVAAGGVAKTLLRRVGTEIRSHVVRIGPESVPLRDDLGLDDFEGVDESPVRCLDPEASRAHEGGDQGRRPGPRHPRAASSRSGPSTRCRASART